MGMDTKDLALSENSMNFVPQYPSRWKSRLSSQYKMDRIHSQYSLKPAHLYNSQMSDPVTALGFKELDSSQKSS